MYYEKSKNDIFFDKHQYQMISLDELVPADHLLRKIENSIDFSFIHKLTKDYYSSSNGRPCLDTITLFKIALLNYIYGKNSIRATLEESKVNMAYRWFLNISMVDKVPNYSTFTQNYIRRYKDTDVFEKIFTVILTKIIEKGLVDPSVIFVDGTHIKANANKHKSIKKEVRVIADKYQKELRGEIDEFREYNGRDKYNDKDEDDPDNYTINEETGEVEEKVKTKTITVSKTDKDAGMFVKGEHERMFAYVDQVACDKSGWILAHEPNPANMHDSKAFLPFFENKLLPFKPNNICLDAGYISYLIMKKVQYEGIRIILPYARPKGRETEFDKRKFTYQMEIDAYLCPNKKILEPMNITRDGYIQYSISKKECGSCPFIKECMKKYTTKTITRHLYEDCKELAKVDRLSPEGKEIYKLRKVTIERKFAEGKERHGLRYTRYKGLKKNRDYRSLLYACMNIKKLALLLSKRTNPVNKLKLT